ncbi:prenyltransferase/squalene oxidase repeat-containing protein [Streptomyces sp. ISL-100]|uniref:prenyltransferase/squalene oxidase repeat-containing protein n=1 Tax=Streptomyces sp. ISL-100 TaxID=2819173 RepID=UPI001BE593DE|nr:prenyltransferase/squalene oxidase repeat-containing protein [Streptomyces sp. ISL-100]MBT2395316.1 terpene cyclase/mutase family protein [Streptomyces sp. ISL-100]
MTLRRSAATVLAASAVLCATATTTVATTTTAAVAAPSPTPIVPSGLYGEKDPTYDGVWRQSLALLAQDTVGVKPAAKAVNWLVGQQCDSGGFPSFRADAAEPCTSKTMMDSNATAAAVQALKALGGQDAAVKKGVSWLKSVQNQDGGWSYNPGGASDSNSTSIVIGALAAAGEKPAEVKSQEGKSPYDALVTFSIPCDAKTGGGAFAYQPDKSGKLAPNADATAAGVLGGLGQGLDAKGKKGGEKPGQKPVKCAKGKLAPPQAAANGATYLTGVLAKTGHLDTAPMPGAEDAKPQPDFGNTADAVVALAAQGGAEQAKKPLEWLEENSAAWAKENGPAAYAQLVLAANATGTDPKSFGGADLVKALNATGPAPEAAESADEEKKDSDDGGAFGTWWIVAVIFIASVGAGILFSGRKKKNQQL